ncbi:type II toxin-antitoxin system YoeB family toxin [Cupriavidus basilensis]
MDDYLSWQAHDGKIVEEINGLIEEIFRDPFRGTGKPEALEGRPDRLLVSAHHEGGSPRLYRA